MPNFFYILNRIRYIEINKITQVGINFADGIEDLINIISINSLNTDDYIQKQFG